MTGHILNYSIAFCSGGENSERKRETVKDLGCTDMSVYYSYLMPFDILEFGTQCHRLLTIERQNMKFLEIVEMRLFIHPTNASLHTLQNKSNKTN